jgi:drug/metabolite transporter (DMT)-like permease
MIVGLCYAVAATVLNTLAGLLQSAGARSTSARRPLVLRPRYVAGLLVDGAGWLCTVAALQRIPVLLVQSVLAGTIVLTALATRVRHRSVLRRVDRVAIAACLAGLVLIAAGSGTERPETVPWWAVLTLGAGASLIAIGMAAFWYSGRGWPLAVLAGLGFGGTSLAVRAVRSGSGLGDLLTQPAAALVVIFWVLGLVAYSRALALINVARLTAVMVVSETAVPGILGVVLLGDAIRPGWWGAVLTGLAFAVAGVVVLAGSPAVDQPAARAR